jgi:hypothetical protein
MNIVSAVSWTDIPTEVMATSSICNQDSVRICSLAVNMVFFSVLFYDISPFFLLTSSPH